MPDLTSVLESIAPDPDGYRVVADADCGRSSIGLLHHVILDSVDLSASKSPVNEHGVRVTIDTAFSYFRNVNFTRCAALGHLCGVFVSCDFSKASAKEAALSGLFIDCAFNGTNLRRSSITGNFEGCAFSGCNLRANTFGGGFKDCTFDANRVNDLFPSEVTNDGSCKQTFSITMMGKTKMNEYIKFHNEVWPNKSLKRMRATQL